MYKILPVSNNILYLYVHVHACKKYNSSQLTESSFAWHVMNAQKTMEQKSSDD